MVSTERDLGPSVPTILVMAGKKLCGFADTVHEKIKLGLRRGRRATRRRIEGAEDAHGLGWLEDGGHPDGLLEQQVRRMHPRCCSSSSSRRSRALDRLALVGTNGEWCPFPSVSPLF
jgi:hypothetical protein